MKIKVAVFFGGKSVEHEISIISALQAVQSLNKDKYDVIPVYITKGNDMYVGEAVGNIEEYKNINALIAKSERVILVNGKNRAELVRYPKKPFQKDFYDYIDVAFPIVHGTNVEDGTIAGYLNMFNVTVVGCDVLSSAVGMDKYVMKAVLKDNGIPVLDCLRFNSTDFCKNPEQIVSEIESRFSYPVIVKPINLGSSVGISKAGDKPALEKALAEAFGYADKVLVERAIQNLWEINCSVLGDDKDATASECERPVGNDEILSYADKYISGGKNSKTSGSKGVASTQRIIPADISENRRDEIRALAVKAFKCLGCNGVSRIDFMIDKDEDKVYFNEINTIPGSLSFYLWEPLGKKYPQLLDDMISLALKRKREQENITYSFDTNVLSGANLGGAKGAKG